VGFAKLRGSIWPGKETVDMARSRRSGGRKSYHVSKSSSGGWKVKGAGAKRASSTHRTQKAAQKAARRLAKKQPKSQVVIHRRNGRIRTEHTYGADPYPPKG
jgi:hypothetical protein